MKRLLALVVVLVLALTCLAGCSVVDTVKDKINTILGKEPEGNTQLDKADAFLFDLYKNAATETPSSYNLVSVVTIEGVKFTVTWASNNEAITIVAAEDPNFVTVVVPKANEPIRYTLTATITDADGNVKTRTFERTVPAFKVFTFAEYAAAEDDATVVVRGVVSGIFSKTNGSSGNGVYIQDLNNEGGYYVYGLVDSKDPEADLGLKVGMTVTVSGIKDTYNGLYEVVTANIEIDDATIKTVEPVDFTEIYKNAAALTDAALVTRQSMLVTVKGVEVGGVKEDNGYYYFKLGALESYIRISSSNNCISKADIDTFKANHTSHKGYKADVTGIIQLYNGAFYLIPVSVDVESNYAEIERTDAEKVALELEGLTLPTKIDQNGEYVAPAAGATYNSVVLNWESDNACAVISNGKLVVTLPEEAATVKITVTATCGEATATKTFEFSVAAAAKVNYTPVIVPEANIDATLAYKLGLFQKSVNKTLFFDGTLAGSYSSYLGVTTNPTAAVDVYLETVEGGFRLYFMNGETKTYIEAVADGNYGNFTFVTENPTAVYKYNAEAKAYTVTLSNGEFYIGTYSNKEEFRLSLTSYITGDNASKVGESQFVCSFYKLEAKEVVLVPEIVNTPAAETAYKFGLFQKSVDKTLFFDGTLAGSYSSYLGVTTNPTAAVDVYLETVEGGFRLYFMNGETKTYIEAVADGNYGNFTFVTENPTAVYKYNAEAKAYTVTLSNGEFYIGTYSNKEEFRLSLTSYITGDNASKVGESQFVCVFYVLVEGEAPEITDADKAAKEKNDLKLDVKEKVVVDTVVELPTAGTTYEDVVITWTATGAEIVEGKVNLVIGNEEQTVTLVATIKVGEATETKEFTVTVAAKPSFEITYPTAIVPGTAYHIYTPEGPVFFGGALSDKNGLATVDTLEEATAIYFEAAAKEGTFYMYFYDANGAKKYIDMTANSTTKFAFVDTAPEKGIWAIDEFGIYNAYWYTDNSAKPDGVSYYRYLAFYANNGDVRTYAPSTTGNPWMKLAEVSEGHTHTDANTDGVCDGCQQEVDETGDTPLTGTDAN